MSSRAQQNYLGEIGEAVVVHFLKDTNYIIIGLSKNMNTYFDIVAFVPGTDLNAPLPKIVTFEVKTDDNCNSGNVFVEIAESRDGLNFYGHGLYSTIAQYFIVYKPCSKTLFIASTAALDLAIAKGIERQESRTVWGGEGKQTLGYLFPEDSWRQRHRSEGRHFAVIDNVNYPESIDRQKYQQILPEFKFPTRPPNVKPSSRIYANNNVMRRIREQWVAKNDLAREEYKRVWIGGARNEESAIL